MEKFFQGVLYLLPVVLTIVFAVFFNQSLQEIHNEIFNEKLYEKHDMVNVMANVVNDMVERNGDWNRYGYTEVLSRLSTECDKTYSVYGATYKENLELISERVVAGQDEEIVRHLPFDPMVYAEFIEAIRNNRNGEIVLPYYRGVNDMTPMYVFYQWYPNNANYQQRALFVVGITHDSVVTHTVSWIRTGLIMLIVITFISNVIFIFILRYLSQIFSQRKGMKWRESKNE